MCQSTSAARHGLRTADPASAIPGGVIASFAMSYFGRCVKGVPESGGPLRRKAAGDFAVPFRPSCHCPESKNGVETNPPGVPEELPLIRQISGYYPGLRVWPAHLPV